MPNPDLGRKFWLTIPCGIAIAFLLGCSGAVAADTPPTPAEVAALEATWPKNDIERQLIGAANDPAKRPDFIRALLHADLCAMTSKAPDPSKPDEHIGLIAVKAPDGEMASPLFTAPERIAETFGEGKPYICGQGGKLLEHFRGSRVVLDPGQPWGFIWTAEELDHILGTSRIINRTTTFELSVPQKEPAALLASLRAVLQPELRVNAAWLALAYWPETKGWSWYLEVHSTLDGAALNESLRDATTGIDMDGKPMDMVVKPPDSPPGKGIEILKR